jgi:hypothetical protein
MRLVKIVGLSALAMTAAAFVGCQSGPLDKAGYAAIEKDNRIYIFVPNSGDYQQFKKTGELTKSVTEVGVGPEGKTVVAPEKYMIDRYVAAWGGKG